MVSLKEERHELGVFEVQPSVSLADIQASSCCISWTKTIGWIKGQSNSTIQTVINCEIRENDLIVVLNLKSEDPQKMNLFSRGTWRDCYDIWYNHPTVVNISFKNKMFHLLSSQVSICWSSRGSPRRRRWRKELQSWIARSLTWSSVQPTCSGWINCWCPTIVSLLEKLAVQKIEWTHSIQLKKRWGFLKSGIYSWLPCCFTICGFTPYHCHFITFFEIWIMPVLQHSKCPLYGNSCHKIDYV